MMEFSEYVSYDAVGLAELVRNGDVPPSDLVAAAGNRMDVVNPTVNAVIRINGVPGKWNFNLVTFNLTVG